MESRQTWEKQLCMSGLRVTHACYEREHHCDAGDGADSARLVLALHGCADIRAPGVQLHVDSTVSGLFYIPEGSQYHIIWTGAPQIEYIIFGIRARQDDTENLVRYGMQSICPDNMDAIRAYARKIASLFASGNIIGCTQRSCRTSFPNRMRTFLLPSRQHGHTLRRIMPRSFPWTRWPQPSASANPVCFICSARHSAPHLYATAPLSVFVMRRQSCAEEIARQRKLHTSADSTPPHICGNASDGSWG